MASLDEQYQQTVEAQRKYLLQLQDAFNKRCDEITQQAAEKLRATPAMNIEEKQKISDEQKKLLNESLAQLKNEVDKSTDDTRRKLEEIHRQREEEKIKQLEDLMTKF